VIASFRVSSAAVVLLVAGLLGLPAQSASAAPVEACAPTPKTATSLCLSYDFTATKAGTTTPTKNTQEPVDVRLAFENTSTDFKTTQGRWLTSVSANLLGSADSNGVIAPSASLPDGLLLAGSSAACGTDQGNFAACIAGSGTGYAVVPDNPLGCAVCDLTFGIQRIENERDSLGIQVSRLKITLNVCVNKQTILSLPRWDCTSGKGLTQVVSLGQVGQPLPFTLKAPTVASTSRTTIGSASVFLQGRSNQLATGGTTPTMFETAKLPMKCGPSSASGSARAVSGATAVVPRSMEIVQCAQLTVGQPGSRRVVFGLTTTISGKLEFYDRDPSGNIAGPIQGAPIVLRACPATAVLKCANETDVVLTNFAGIFTFTVAPRKNTRYFVEYEGFEDDPIVLLGSYYSRNVNVAPKITRTPDRTRIRSGQRVRLTGKVYPNHAGQLVSIQRLTGGVWKRVARTTLTNRSTYSRSLILKGARGSTARLRVILPAHSDHLLGSSPSVRIRFS